MPYKLRDQTPTVKATTIEIADFIEIECLKKPDLKISFLEIVKSFDVGDDYQEDDIDENYILRDNQEEVKVLAAFSELEKRKICCNGNYPFNVEDNLVKVNSPNHLSSIVYIYLLLATRLTMGGRNMEREFNNVDGTLLFEKFCEIILNSFYGERTKSILFGTSAKGLGFENKVKQLIEKLKEGGVYKNRNPSTPAAQDDNLDIVAWKGFSDSKGSQLIGFAQCKTGDSWKGETEKLSPSKFTGSWFSDEPILVPAKIFMIADIAGQDYFSTFMTSLFFDRCRLMDYLPNHIDEPILLDIKNWLKGAAEKYNLNLAIFLN